METIIVNKFGTVQGWSNITFNMLGRDVEGISKIAYDDNLTKENVYGAGNMPIGRSRGNYEAKASITLLKEENDALVNSLPPGKRLQDVAPFDIPVKYEIDGVIKFHIIRNVEFTNNSVDVSQGDGSIAVDHELIVSHIDWNVV